MQNLLRNLFRDKYILWKVLSGIRLFIGWYALIHLAPVLFLFAQESEAKEEMLLHPLYIFSCLFWLGIFIGLFFITKKNVAVSFFRLLRLQGFYLIFTVVNYALNPEIIKDMFEQPNPVNILLNVSPLLVFGVLWGGHLLAKHYVKSIEENVQE